MEHWSPNQLRHTRATEVRAQFGLDGAASILGHAQIGVTQVYAEQDQARALEVARRIGDCGGTIYIRAIGMCPRPAFLSVTLGGQL